MRNKVSNCKAVARAQGCRMPGSRDPRRPDSSLVTNKIPRQKNKWWGNKKQIDSREANTGKTVDGILKTVSKVPKTLPG